MNKQELPPEGRFCDLVMKGGITSGVVYPRAIVKLANHYYFKNIGGTSAGAVAAVATAAAEYRRRYKHNMEGFEELAKLPKILGDTNSKSNQSGLLTLFQPQSSTKRLFKVLISSLDKSVLGGAAAIFGGLLLAYLPATIASIGFALFIGCYEGAFAGLLSGLIAILFSIGFWAFHDATKNVVDNGYGLCTGMNASDTGADAMTPWLHKLIQNTAGIPVDGKPLTFGDLWDAPGYLKAAPGSPPGTVRSINLVMFTANLSHGRPYTMPFEDKSSKLYYKKEELAKYLPDTVMEWFNKGARAWVPPTGSDGKILKVENSDGMFELPPPEDFPIVLAARMSMSFPLLFSSIPFWAIDDDTDENVSTFRRCCFTDGGLCSNFPMHLFDGLVPRWPTFGIMLEPKLSKDAKPVYLPPKYEEGYGERWDKFDDDSKSSIMRFGGFLGSVISVMQNWNDTALSRMPGVRDRVARVRLTDQEGGMNLTMDSKKIEALAGYGEEAAAKLVSRFVPDTGTGSAAAVGWDQQRWVRLNVFLRMLESRLPGVEMASKSGVPYARDFADLIRDAMITAPPGRDTPLSAEEAAALDALVKCLVQFANDFGEKKYSFSPIPEPDLRVRPSL